MRLTLKMAMEMEKGSRREMEEQNKFMHLCSGMEGRLEEALATRLRLACLASQ